MTEVLTQILLVVAIVACVLLIANLIRLYKILSDFSEASDAIKNIVNSVSKLISTWHQSAKNVAEFVGEVSSYVNVFKKLKGDSDKKEKEQDER